MSHAKVGMMRAAMPERIERKEMIKDAPWNLEVQVTTSHARAGKRVAIKVVMRAAMIPKTKLAMSAVAAVVAVMVGKGEEDVMVARTIVAMIVARTIVARTIVTEEVIVAMIEVTIAVVTTAVVAGTIGARAKKAKTREKAKESVAIAEAA